MDKKALQTFALFAKDSLETQIKVSLKLIGIHSDKDIKKAYIQGDFTIIEGDSKTYPSDLKVKRDHILELIKTDGYAYTIEQFAYTWFNRLIALRFMEVHDYLPHGFKVFPKGTGSIEPEILGKLTLVEKELNIDIELCRQFKEKAQIEELYRYVLFQQCNALSGFLPMLFSKEYAYLELMLPSTLLKGTTVITELIKIDESNFLDDIEVIGWLYQFYVSSDREEFRKAKVVNKDLIPTLTQIFTPDWIVRYMTENSLGRLWLESYPDSSVKKEFKYYVEDAEQTEEVKKQIESIRYKNVDPKDIKVIEPCSGSGHILVYAFDVLMLMYEEKGYSKNDIPKLILDNNLFGLDVDKRASQLASFSLIMKARSIDSRFFQPSRISYPKVFEIKDSKMLISMDYKKKILDLNNNDWKKDEHLSDEELKVIDYVIETFDDGKVIGSLLKVKRDNYVPLISKMNHLHKVTIRGIFNGEFVEYGLKRIVQLLRLAEIMSRKYDVLITNPPYLSTSKFEDKQKYYFRDNYPNSKSDMFAMFMETELTRKNGLIALVNPDTWMFLGDYLNHRNSILRNKTIINMIHIKEFIFDSVVSTTTFITREFHNGYAGIYIPYYRGINERVDLKNQKYYCLSSKLFLDLPNSPICYWLSKNMLSVFNKAMYGEYCVTREGMTTADNEMFLRFWYEINYYNIYSEKTEGYWVPYNKGGEYRKWYGNHYYVVNWKNNGFDIKNNIDKSTGRVRSHNYNGEFAYKEGFTWSGFSSSDISVRYTPTGFMFDSKGSMGFSNGTISIKYLIGLYNSIVGKAFLKIFSATTDYKPGQLILVPLIIDRTEDIISLVEKNIRISKSYWDTFEISRDFTRHPLVGLDKISNLFQYYFNSTVQAFDELKNNEEVINQNFIDIYSLNEDLNSEIEEASLSIDVANKNRECKSLISYLVGVLMGRYSLKKEGLIYAGGYFDPTQYGKYDYSKDGIIPIYSDININYSLSNRIVNLIKEIYGHNLYRDNIDFIAESLGKKTNESSEETLNRYLNNDFYSDHLKIYQKRPIYWLLSSGKQGAFKCLIYMHKYNEDTLATINSQLLLPESARLKYESNEIVDKLNKSNETNRRILEKEKSFIENKYNEIIEYGQVLDHMANRYISIDLDDGVKVNYEKFQGIEIVTDSGTRIKKDLLVPIK